MIAQEGSKADGREGEGVASRGDRGEGERGLGGLVWWLGWGESRETRVIGCGAPELIGKMLLHAETDNPANERPM